MPAPVDPLTFPAAEPVAADCCVPAPDVFSPALGEPVPVPAIVEEQFGLVPCVDPIGPALCVPAPVVLVVGVPDVGVPVVGVAVVGVVCCCCAIAGAEIASIPIAVAAAMLRAKYVCLML